MVVFTQLYSLVQTHRAIYYGIMELCWMTGRMDGWKEGRKEEKMHDFKLKGV